MLAAGLIEESDERPDPILDDERRRYYRLAGFGRKVLVAEMDRLSEALEVAGPWAACRCGMPALASCCARSGSTVAAGR